MFQKGIEWNGAFDPVIESPVWTPHSENSPNSTWFSLDIENTMIFMISVSCCVIKPIGIAFCGSHLEIIPAREESKTRCHSFLCTYQCCAVLKNKLDRTLLNREYLRYHHPLS